MTIDEMISQLEEIRDSYNAGDVEIRIATQPNYPLRNKVQDLVPGCELDVDQVDGDVSYLWITVDESIGWNESPYAPRALFDPR